MKSPTHRGGTARRMVPSHAVAIATAIVCTLIAAITTAWTMPAHADPACVPNPSTGKCTQPAPPAYTLDVGVATQIKEPATNAWSAYLCGAGASAVALSYWGIDVLHYAKQHGGSVNAKVDPAGNTARYDDTNGHAYLMYLASQVKPPSYPTPGEVSLVSPVENSGATNSDVADALNWEASGHNTNTWKNFFYQVTPATPGLSLQTLNADIDRVIGSEHRPVIMAINDGKLPEWRTSGARGGGHLVAVVGYDNTAHTYTIVETCTNRMCQTSGGSNGDGTGTNTVGQQDALDGLINDAGIGALIW